MPPVTAERAVSCTSCLDVVRPAHPAEHCPYALLRSWRRCVDCLQPPGGVAAGAGSPSDGGGGDGDSDDDEEYVPYGPEYVCSCGGPTAAAVTRREAELATASTWAAVGVVDLPRELSPFVGTALRDHPAHRVTEEECPGARHIRLRLETVMPARMIAGDVGPAVRCTAVDTLEGPVTPEVLQVVWDRFVKHNLPVKITGAIDGWAPLKWTPERLKQLAGHRTITVRGQSGGVGGVYGDPGRSGVYEEEAAVPLGDFVDAALQHPDGGCPYYAARLLLDTLPELLAETPNKSPIGACFGNPLEFGAITYMGAGGNTTPTHLDYYENSFAVVQGAKRLVLYPPSQSDLLRPRGEGCNFSTIPALTPRDSPEFPYLSCAKPLEVTVRQGELLYLPFGWWHTVTGEGFNVIVNHWHKMRLEKKFVVDPGLVLE